MSEPRGHWRSNTGFILAATGSAIGLGNLWKFPFITDLEARTSSPLHVSVG